MPDSNKLLGLLGYGSDALQGASNAVASNVSAPVDAIAWLLGKAGVPMPSNPVGGSEWMKQNNLIQEPKNKLAALLGETAGMVTPTMMAAKAPQIAKGLLQVGENAAVPNMLNKQAGAVLFHGSNSRMPITRIKDDGVFEGLFSHPDPKVALSHGDELYRMTIPDEKIMSANYDAPYDAARNVIENNIRKQSPYVDDVTDMVLSNKDAFRSNIPEEELLHALRSGDMGEASWELQRLRGLVAKDQGFKAVQMPDEHGMSYLVLPDAAKPRPANPQSKKLYK